MSSSYYLSLFYPPFSKWIHIIWFCCNFVPLFAP